MDIITITIIAVSCLVIGSLAGYLFLTKKEFEDLITELALMYAEETLDNAKEYMLENEKEIKEWAYSWYHRLPDKAKVFISRQMWEKKIDWAIDELRDRYQEVL